jgi:choline-sulfatase
MYPGEGIEDVFQVNDFEGGGMGFWKDLGEEAVQMLRSPSGGMHGGMYPENEPYPPDKVAENALEWMDNEEGPYLTRLSLLQPHTPVLPPAQYVRLYEDQDPGLPGELPGTISEFERRVAQVHGLDRMAPEDLRTARIHYYAQVAWVDAQVGRVLDYLEAAGRLQHTVIVFGSDHGNPVGDTGAFGKHTFTPTVHRVPLIISWPEALPRGEVRDDISESLDVARTLLRTAEIEPPPLFEGRDLFSEPEPDAIYSTIGYGQHDSWLGPNGGSGRYYGDRGWPRRSCIRTPRYRLDKNMLLDGEVPAPTDEHIFLADVQSDPEEMVNLADDPEHSAIVRELSEKLDRFAEGSVEVPHECLVR